MGKSNIIQSEKSFFNINTLLLKKVIKVKDINEKERIYIDIKIPLSVKTVLPKI